MTEASVPEVAAVREKLASYSQAEIDSMLRQALAQAAREDDSPKSFAAFYELVHGREMPFHAYYEWVIPAYYAHGKMTDEELREYYVGEVKGVDLEGAYGDMVEKLVKDRLGAVAGKAQGIVIEAFRGSAKTTTITITFTAYRIGKEPQRANLLIQVSDDIAMDNTGQIADIIENNPGFKMVFPNVVPDKERGWGAGGYEVKRTDTDYSTWRAKNSKRKDPTLIGVGYKSSEIIGKHPDGLLINDDIHDERNTASHRELEMVKKILTGTIFPTVTPTTWKVFIGTPWVKDDVLHYVAGTGGYLHVQTPIYRGMGYEASYATAEEIEGERIWLTWGKQFGVSEILTRKKLSGKVEFARMYLLDLTLVENVVFRYQDYPHSEIKFNWPMVGGADYAGTADERANKEGKNCLFALAYVAKRPGGGAVVVDGVVDHCTQGQAEQYTMRAQQIYPYWLKSVIEMDGKGEEFFQLVRRNPKMRVVGMKTHQKGKYERLVKEMSPWLENGAVQVSDAETPFLVELRRELDNYPFVDKTDALDALYWALRGMPDQLKMSYEPRELPKIDFYEQMEANKNVENPFAGFGRS